MSSSGEFVTSLLGGGAAGTMVDIVLYPLDTIKTRLQSEAGFFQSGGFKGVYRGLSSAAAGSAPCGACLLVEEREEGGDKEAMSGCERRVAQGRVWGGKGEARLRRV